MRTMDTGSSVGRRCAPSLSSVFSYRMWSGSHVQVKFPTDAMQSRPVTHTDACSPMACNVTRQASVENDDLFFRVVGWPKAA